MTTQSLSAQDVAALRTKIMKEEAFFGQERDKFLTALSLADQALSANGWKCLARSTADPPQDCDWPVCGCDPHANKVIGALEEAGAVSPSCPSWEDKIGREARVAALEEAAALLHACALNLVGGRRTNHANRCSSAILVRLRDQVRALAHQPAKDGQ